jgi:hypothetical protein
LVSIDILRDGEQPKRPTNSKEYDLLPFRIARRFESFDRVKEAGVRMREEGHVFFGEAFTVPKNEDDLVTNCRALAERSRI